jgi:hypothetical protein
LPLFPKPDKPEPNKVDSEAFETECNGVSTCLCNRQIKWTSLREQCDSARKRNGQTAEVDCDQPLTGVSTCDVNCGECSVTLSFAPARQFGPYAPTTMLLAPAARRLVDA